MRWLVLLASIALASTAYARWGDGSCSPSVAVAATPPAYEWRRRTGDVDNVYLFRDGVQVGGWNIPGGFYRSFDAASGRWGDAETPSPQNFGVDSSKLKGDTRYEMNGVEVTKQKAVDAITNKIPDDAKKLRYTVIGTKEQQERVKTALASSELKDLVSEWYVEPGHFSLTDTSTGKLVFKTGGSPTIYLQAPNGKVLHRQDDFQGAQDFQAIRKAVKGYDSALDPDLRKSPVNPSSNIISPWMLLVAAVGGWIYINKRKEK